MFIPPKANSIIKYLRKSFDGRVNYLRVTFFPFSVLLFRLCFNPPSRSSFLSYHSLLLPTPPFSPSLLSLSPFHAFLSVEYLITRESVGRGFSSFQSQKSSSSCSPVNYQTGKDSQRSKSNKGWLVIAPLPSFQLLPSICWSFAYNTRQLAAANARPAGSKGLEGGVGRGLVGTLQVESCL